MKGFKEIAVLIPAYNASRSLRGVIEGIRGHGLHILVVDDGSADATAEIARELEAQVVRHRVNRGKGMALRIGFRVLLHQGYQAVITLDADGQHDPSFIPQFIRAYQEGRGDIIIGSRAEEFGQMNWLRRFWNKLGGKGRIQTDRHPLHRYPVRVSAHQGGGIGRSSPSCLWI